MAELKVRLSVGSGGRTGRKRKVEERMTLGIISWIQEEDFKKVKEKGLSFVELDVNDRAEEFLAKEDLSAPLAGGAARALGKTASVKRNYPWNAA